MAGTQVPTLPLAVAGVNGVQWYFRFGMGSEKWGRIFGLSDLLPSLSEISHSICLEVVKEMLGVSRNSEHRALRVGVLRLREWNAIQSQSHTNALI